MITGDLPEAHSPIGKTDCSPGVDATLLVAFITLVAVRSNESHRPIRKYSFSHAGSRLSKVSSLDYIQPGLILLSGNLPVSGRWCMPQLCRATGESLVAVKGKYNALLELKYIISQLYAKADKIAHVSQHLFL